MQWGSSLSDGLSPQCCGSVPGGCGQVSAAATDQIMHIQGAECTHVILHVHVATMLDVHECKCVYYMSMHVSVYI